MKPTVSTEREGGSRSARRQPLRAALAVMYDGIVRLTLKDIQPRVETCEGLGALIPGDRLHFSRKDLTVCPTCASTQLRLR
jgi:hypothetical protein